MNSYRVKTEEHDYLHLAFHFTVPLKVKMEYIKTSKLQLELKLKDYKKYLK